MIYNFTKFVATKAGPKNFFFPLLFYCSAAVRSGIRDTRSGFPDGYKSGSGINITDPQCCKNLEFEDMHTVLRIRDVYPGS